MKSVIYTFTSTGNSLEITRLIAKNIGNCEIKPIQPIVPDEAIGGTDMSIGFVFPVFYIGIPRIVKNFIENLNILPETYCFAYISFNEYGFDTLGSIDDILKKKELCLSYADEVKMPGNFLLMYQALPFEKTEIRIKNAMRKVEKFATDIVSGVKRPIKRNVISKLLTKIANRSLYKNIAEWDNKFKVSDRCTSCRTCVKVCPVSNIRIDNKYPVWLHHCERCLRCIHWCPCEAIQYGKKTIGRRRYHNPKVKVKDIISLNTEA